MGHLTYAGSTQYEIEDRMLAHVKAVVAAKLRRQESFLLSWAVDANAGSGRVSIWMSPSIPLEFRFAGSRVPQLNGVWLEALMEMANSTRGLVLVSEQEAEQITAGKQQAPIL
ncbi:hypothetical protein GCM10009846_04150 [Agrococcus versicolor]|uniref:DUF7882 domain-containing protein n=1 Tax=Agrococcus versicolor TaxID=501482 RepID=A0ABN3AJZ8_9MICO